MKPYLNQVSGKIEKDINLFTGGLNTYVNKAFIEDNQLSYAMNVGMYEPPKLSTRPSRVTLAWFFSNTENYALGFTIKEIYAYSEDEIYTIEAKDEYTYLIKYKKDTLGFSRTTISLIPSYDNYYMCYCRQATDEYLYIMNESFKVRVQINTEGENIYKTYEDNIYGIPAFHKGRLFIANPNTNIISFSALYDFDNFALVNNNYIIVEELPENDIKKDAIYLIAKNDTQYYQYYWWNDKAWKKPNALIEKSDLEIDYSIIAGDFQVTNAKGKVVALKSFDNKLMVFCEYSIHVLYGDSPNTELNFFTLIDLDNGIGAISSKSIDIGGGKLYWLGDDLNIYEYTGAYINIVSRPSEYNKGGIEGLIQRELFMDRKFVSNIQFACTGSKLYINFSSNPTADIMNNMLLVYDMHNHIWWCEDGKFTAIGKYQSTVSTILLARKGGDILISKVDSVGDTDQLFDTETRSIKEQIINYAFETKVYGIDGVSMRKTLTNIWFQASAKAKVYVGDFWLAINHWKNGLDLKGYKYVGDLKIVKQPRTDEYYNSSIYESQRLIIPKMQIERVNGFTILVKGVGIGEFYLMEREWRAI